MANDNALINSTKKPNFFKKLNKKLFKKNCTYIDYKGNIGYIKYPPKKGFDIDLFNDIRYLEIENVEIIDDKTDPKDDLRHLRFLEKITLGKGVKGVSKYSIPTTVNEIVLSDDVVNIPEGYVANGSITKVSTSEYTFDSQYANFNNSFFIDEFKRVNFTRTNHLSIAELNTMDKHDVDLEKATTNLRNTCTESLLHHSGKHPTNKSFYVYAKSLDTTRNYSIIAVADTYPMPEEHKKNLSDENLVGIMINDADSIDLSELNKYPHLQTVYLGKSVEKLTGTTNPFDGKVDNRGHKQLLEFSKTGKQQSIIMLSDKIEVISNTQTAETQSEQITPESDADLKHEEE